MEKKNLLDKTSLVELTLSSFEIKPIIALSDLYL